MSQSCEQPLWRRGVVNRRTFVCSGILAQAWWACRLSGATVSADGHAIGLALSRRIEFAADLGLSLVDSGKLGRVEIAPYLERLIDRVGEARVPYRTAPAPRPLGLAVDEQRVERFFWDVGVTGCDIRIRALKRLASLDYAQARSRLIKTRIEYSGKDGCEALEVPDPGASFYQILFDVFPREFEWMLTTVTNPIMVGRLLEMLRASPGVKQGHYNQASVVILRVLGQAPYSDRTFTVAESGVRLGRLVQEMLARVKLDKLRLPIARAYLEYVSRQLQQPHCADFKPADLRDVYRSYEGHTFVEAVLFRAEAIAQECGIPIVKLASSNFQYAAAPPIPSALRQIRAACDEVLAFAWALANTGSRDSRGRLVNALQKSSGWFGRPLSFTWGAVTWVIGLLRVLAEVPDTEVTALTLQNIMLFVESGAIKSAGPATWIYVIRFLLNAARPTGNAGARVIGDRLAASKDVDVGAYLAFERSLGVLGSHVAKPFDHRAELLGRY